MIRLYCEFDTLEEAELWRDGMYRAYAPEGYSTHISIKQDERAMLGREGKIQREIFWVAYGSRAESCD